MKIWLDDFRSAPEGWTHCLTAEAMMDALEWNWDSIECVSLDHDLGTELDGMDVLNHIEELAFTWNTMPFVIHIHTANPAESSRMRKVASALMTKYGKEKNDDAQGSVADIRTEV